MEEYIPTALTKLLLVGFAFSFILMSFIQKFKVLPWVNKEWHIWLLNLIFSFTIGIPFSMFFYDLNIYDSLWVSLFSFIGAPSLYTAFKNQNLINIKPTSLDDSVNIPKENEIKTWFI